MRRQVLKNILIISFVLNLSVAESSAMNSDVQAVLTDRAKAVLQEAAQNGARNLKFPVRFLLFLREHATTSENAGFAPANRQAIAQTRMNEIKAALKRGLKGDGYFVTLPPAIPRKDKPTEYWVWVDTRDVQQIQLIAEVILKTQSCVEVLDIEQARLTIAGRFSAEKPDPFGSTYRIVKSTAPTDQRRKLLRAIIRHQKDGHLEIISATETSLILRCESESVAKVRESLTTFPQTTFERLQVKEDDRNPLQLSEMQVSHPDAGTVKELVQQLDQKKFTLVVTKAGKTNLVCRISRATRDELRGAGFRVE